MGREQGESQSGQAHRQLSGSDHRFRRSRLADHSRPRPLAGREPVHCFGPSAPDAAIISASLARGPRAAAKENTMKKPSAKSADREMQPEYDFSTGVRGKHFQRYHRGTNVVVLEPDVAKFFSNAETVNDSLRALAGIIRRQKAVVK